MNVRSSRNSRGEDSDRWPRGDRDRDKDRLPRDGEISEPPLRRNGIGRGRFEKSWRDEFATGDGDGGKSIGGWRDRDRERNSGRGRYEQKPEEQPEWMMDDTKEETSKPARTQEEFQRWKESQKAGKIATTTADDKVEAAAPSETSKEPKSSAPKSTVPLSTGSGFDDLFGKLDGLKSDGPSPAKPAISRPKPSRFASMFSTNVDALQPQEPEHLAADTAIPVASSTADEDKQGFQRILQMLELKASSVPGNNVGEPLQEPQATLERDFPHSQVFPEQQPAIERELRQEQIPTGQQPDNVDFLADVLARQGLGRDVKSVPPAQSRVLDLTIDPNHGPEARYYGTIPFPIEGINVQPRTTRMENLTPRNGPFAPPPEGGIPHGRGVTQLDRNSEFLLSLMSSQSNQQPARPAQAEVDFMLERQQMQARAQIPQPQGTRVPHGPPPPGFMEPPAQQQRRGPHAPPGFPDLDDPPMAGLQRRKTTDIPQRSQMTNMGIPSQHALPPDWMKNPPPGMPLPNHPERGNIPPPPGFTTNPTNMRPPPGYPNGPQMPPNLGNGPLTHPGMGGRGPPPGMFPGPPTPGYFGPNGPAQPGMNPPPPGPPGFMMMGPGGGRGIFDGFGPAPNDMGRGRGNPPPGFNAF